MIFFIRLLLLSVIGLGLCLPLAAEESDKVRPPAPEWQIQGALAAWRDAIPEVKVLGLKKLVEIGMVEKIPVEEFTVGINHLLTDENSRNNLLKSIILADEFVSTKFLKNYVSMERYKVLVNPKISTEYFSIIVSEVISFLEKTKEKIHPCQDKISYLRQILDKKELILKHFKLINTFQPRQETSCLLFDLLKNSTAKPVENYVPIVVEMIKTSFVFAYGEWRQIVDALGKIPENFLLELEIVKLLESEERLTIYETLDILGALQNSQGLSEENELQIEKLLDHEDSTIRRIVLNILIKGSQRKKYIPKITEFVQSGDFLIKWSGIIALANLAKLEEEYMPQVAKLLEQVNNKNDKRFVKLILELLVDLGEKEVLKSFFSNVGIINLFTRRFDYFSDYVLKKSELVEEFAPLLVNLLDEKDDDIRKRVIEFLGKAGESAKGYIPQLIKILETTQSEHTFRATLEALENLGEPLQNHLPEILKRWENFDSIVHFLGNTREMNIDLLPVILSPLYKSNELSYRFVAHIVGAGKPDIETLLKWLGDPRDNYPQTTISYDEAKTALNVFTSVWQHALPFPKVREDLEKQIAVVITQRDIRWSSNDLPLLQTQLDHLQSVHSNYAGSVKIAIDALQTKHYAFLLGQLWLLHASFWLILIFIYPKSRRVQAIFFWNPYVRKIIGFGYINLALTWIPYLRHKLLMPFKELLIADADLKDFNESAYFANSIVIHKRTKEKARLIDAIPQIEGQIILEGDSGLGKSMFLRHLVNHSHRTLLYLPAGKCGRGIMAAIEAKLHGVAQDSLFLKSLIYSGALDICIDGLNEVSANVRAELTQFLDSYAKGNILIATQPLLDWSPPKTAETYVLQPLQEEQMAEFLSSRYPTLSTDKMVLEETYQHICRDYLAEILTQPPEVLKAIQRLLTNPMDATFIAQTLAHGEKPDIFRLQEQHYQLMAKTYESYFHKSFPLKEFSAHIYQMRLDNRTAIPHEQFDDEITCMERFKMVFSRQSLDALGRPRKEWYFRHDKIMEFFIVQTFLGDSEKPLEHLNDSRFRGVYFLLANLLPLEDAMILREQLIEYAADTQDHLVSDKFIQLLRSRKTLAEV